MDVDAVVEELGGFGRYQLYVTILTYVTVIFCGMPVVQDTFVNYTPDYRCYVPHCDASNTSYLEWFLNDTTPNEDGHWDQCNYYLENSTLNSNGTKDMQLNYPFQYIDNHEFLPPSRDISSFITLWFHGFNDEQNSNRNVKSMLSKRSPSQMTRDHLKGPQVLADEDPQCEDLNFDDENTVSCDHGWVYDRELWKSSTVTEFDLTCDRAFMATATTSAYMLGMLLGAFSIGILSDKFGRKAAFLVSVLLAVGGGVGGALSVSPIMLMLMRLPTGMGAVGLFESVFIIGVEAMPMQSRSMGMLINVPFALGEALVGVFAYFIRDWRTLQLVVSLPSAILLSYYWVMPESLRWLVSKGRNEEAEKLVRSIAKLNKVPVPSHLFHKEVSEAPRSKTALDLFRKPNMRKRTLNLFVLWMVVNMVYYGLSQNTSNLGGNLFVNFIAMMLIEIPSYILATLLFDRIGRKATLTLCILVAGIPCTISAFLPVEWTTAILTLGLMGKFGAAAAFGIVYLYASEIFPTEYRCIGVGACSMCARFSGILAPIIAGLGKKYPPLPMLIFGLLSCASVVCVLFLPETVGAVLPQTLDDSEQFGADQSIFYFYNCRSYKNKKQLTNQQRTAGGPPGSSDGKQ